MSSASSSSGAVTARPHPALKPFVPRDVFRLIVRLEAQKRIDVDTDALERRFRVPTGYSKDETEEQRELQLLEKATPGPGAYEAPTQWNAGGRQHESAVFASKSTRDAFHLHALEKQAELAAAAKKAGIKTESSSKMVEQFHLPLQLVSSPPMGSFTRAERGLSTTETDEDVDSPTLGKCTTSSLSLPRSTFEARGVAFCRAKRDVPLSRLALGPAEYEVRRLWDLSPTTGVAMPDAPSAAVFSASMDKRDVVWSPARSLPSNAVPEAWNASAHYEKHKRQVLKQVEAQRRRQLQHHGTTKNNSLGHSISTPLLPHKSSRGKRNAKASCDGCSVELDPFAWLRQLPHGEVRTNALAMKHGLHDHVRSPTSSAPQSSALDQIESTGLCQHDVGESDPPTDHVLHESQAAHELRRDDDDMMKEMQLLSRDASAARLSSGGHAAADDRYQQQDERIIVSCRLPGGFVFSVHTYSAKKLRQLKTTIVRKQTRFQHEDQFDLYLPNGKKLTQANDTLHQSGVQDRSLVQIVPTASGSSSASASALSTITK